MRKEPPSPSPLLSGGDNFEGGGFHEDDLVRDGVARVIGSGFPHSVAVDMGEATPAPGAPALHSSVSSFEMESDSLLGRSPNAFAASSYGERSRSASASSGSPTLGSKRSKLPTVRRSGSFGDTWGAVSDLDEFFIRIYNYYREKGFACIIMRRLSELVKIGFTVVFYTFLFWICAGISSSTATTRIHAESFLSYVDSQFFARENRGASFWGIVAYFTLFLLYWAWMVFSLLPSARVAWDMRRFYREKLLITTDQLQTMTWSAVVERLLELQRSGRYRFQINKSSLSAQHIAMRIMRKENYLIAMINHAVLPFGSDVGGCFSSGWYLGKSLEVNLQLCLLNHMFSNRFTLRRKFVANPDLLARRFRWMGLANLIATPFILMFMLVFFFLKHAEEFHSKKNYLGRRWWSPHMVWAIREFNELPHYFQNRLCLALPHSDSFLKQFPSPLPSVLAGGVSFLLGSIVGVLLIFTFMDESIMLYVTVWDRNLLWYMAVLSLSVAIARSFIPPAEERVFQPNQEMQKVATYTHYIPLRWRGRIHTYGVRDEFADMFQFKAMLFLREIACVLLTPFIMAFVLPSYAEKVAKFVEDVTVSEDGVGDVCAFSMMNLKRHGDAAYGSSRDAAGARSTLKCYDGKLEKSWLNFWVSHPEWAKSRTRPADGGDELVATLEAFQRRATQEKLIRASNMLASSSSSSVMGGRSMDLAQSAVSDGAASAHASLVCELAGSMMMQSAAASMTSASMISQHESFFANARSVFLPLRDVRFTNGENLFHWLELYRDDIYFRRSDGNAERSGQKRDDDDRGIVLAAM